MMQCMHTLLWHNSAALQHYIGAHGAVKRPEAVAHMARTWRPSRSTVTVTRFRRASSASRIVRSRSRSARRSCAWSDQVSLQRSD
jgi:hypothetical protein